MLFQPKGERPEWRMLYDLMRVQPRGTVLTYEALDDALGRPFLANRSPFYKALKEVETHDQRTFEAIRNEGYRCDQPAEHQYVAVAQHKRPVRHLKAAGRKIKAADRTQLSHELVTRFDALEHHWTVQAAKLEQRLDKVDQRVGRTEKDQAATADQIGRLVDRLREHGIDIGDI